MDPRAQLRVHQLDASGGAIVAVWHSHVEWDRRALVEAELRRRAPETSA